MTLEVSWSTGEFFRVLPNYDRLGENDAMTLLDCAADLCSSQMRQDQRAFSSRRYALGTDMSNWLLFPKWWKTESIISRSVWKVWHAVIVCQVQREPLRPHHLPKISD